MQTWRDKWFVSREHAPATDPSGGDANLHVDLASLRRVEARDFDRLFLRMAIEHKAAAIAMSQDTVQKAELSEVRELAQIVINREQDESKQLIARQRLWQ